MNINITTTTTSLSNEYVVSMRIELSELSEMEDLNAIQYYIRALEKELKDRHTQDRHTPVLSKPTAFGPKAIKPAPKTDDIPF